MASVVDPLHASRFIRADDERTCKKETPSSQYANASHECSPHRSAFARLEIDANGELRVATFERPLMVPPDQRWNLRPRRTDRDLGFPRRRGSGDQQTENTLLAGKVAFPLADLV